MKRTLNASKCHWWRHQWLIISEDEDRDVFLCERCSKRRVEMKENW